MAAINSGELTNYLDEIANQQMRVNQAFLAVLENVPQSGVPNLESQYEDVLHAMYTRLVSWSYNPVNVTRLTENLDFRLGSYGVDNDLISTFMAVLDILLDKIMELRGRLGYWSGTSLGVNRNVLRERLYDILKQYDGARQEVLDLLNSGSAAPVNLAGPLRPPPLAIPTANLNAVRRSLFNGGKRKNKKTRKGRKGKRSTRRRN